MGQLVNELLLKTGQHNSEIDKAKDKVHRYKEEADAAGKSVEEMGNKQSRSAKELLDAMKDVEGVGRSTSNYRQQLAAITRQISDLTIGYRQMNDEMRNSDFGREVAGKIEELTQRAASYRDAIGDVQNEIKNLSSDTQGWDAMKQGIDLVSSSFQTFVSMGVLSANSTEKLMKIIAKLKAIEQSTNLVIKIGNALQKDSALMRRITTLRTQALAVAENAEATAASRAAVATQAFTTAIKANPFLAVASVILTAVSAITLFTGKTKEDTEAQKKHKEELEKQKKIFEDYKNALGDSVGGIIGQYNTLRYAWKDLTSEQEKNKWLKENQEAFKRLGFEIKDVNTANKIFVEQADAVIEALRAIAEAEALKGLYQDAYIEQVKTEIAANKEMAEGLRNLDATKYLRSDMAGAEEIWKKAGITARDYVKDVQSTIATGSKSYVKVLNDEGIKKVEHAIADMLIEQRNGAVEAATQGATDILTVWRRSEQAAIEARNRLSKMGSPSTPSGKGGGNTTTTDEYKITIDRGSLTEAEKQLAHLKAVYEATLKAPDNMENFNKAKKDYEDMLKVVEQLRKEYYEVQEKETDKEVFTPGSLNEAEAKIREITKELNNMSPDDANFDKTLDELDKWIEKEKEIKDLMERVDADAEGVADMIKEASDAVGEIQMYYDVGLISKETAQKQILAIQKEFEGYGVHLDLVLNVKASNFDKTLELFSKYKSKIDDFSSSISKAYDSISSLGDKLEEEQDPIKRFFLYFDAISSSVSALQSVVSTINAVANALSNNVKLTEEDTVATLTNTAAREVNENVRAAVAASSGTTVTGLQAETTALGENTVANAANAVATELSADAKKEEAVASAENTTAQQAEKGATLKNAIAKMMAAIAGGSESASKAGPIIGAIAAVAAAIAITAALVSAFSKAKSQKFSTGGIFNGKYSVGDKGWARLNDGEMVLNTRQQKKLFQMLNSNGIIDKNDNTRSNGTVHFEIEGSRLVGVLNNYNGKISHAKR